MPDACFDSSILYYKLQNLPVPLEIAHRNHAYFSTTMIHPICRILYPFLIVILLVSIFMRKRLVPGLIAVVGVAMYVAVEMEVEKVLPFLKAGDEGIPILVERAAFGHFGLMILIVIELLIL
jgi:hypothetical protein